MNFQPHAGRLAPRHGAQHPIAPPETVPALTWPADAVMAAADLLRGRWLAGIAITAFIAAVVAVPIVATVITVECWWHVTAPLPGNAALSALRRSCLIEALGAVAAFAMLGAPILAGLLHIATQAASTGRLGFKGWLAGFRSFRDVVVISGAAGLICCLVCVHWAFALLWPAVWFCMCLAIGERVRLRCALGDALRGAREIVSQARLMLITNGITSVVLLAGGALSAWLVCESAGRGLGAYVSLWDPRTYAGDRL
ncbi:MAG TPA: hypothetical protein QGH10_01795, partial [Armatimonadota bacterium]|nr:hypothetical protein [Armatimonadota bacterium]